MGTLPPREVTWRRRRDVLHRSSAGRVLLLRPDAHDPVVLDGVAVLVWAALASPATQDELAAAMAEVLPEAATAMSEGDDPVGDALTRLAAVGVIDEQTDREVDR